MKDKKKDDGRNIAKYSGMAFQLFAITGIGALIGNFLDKKQQNVTPYYSAAGAILFLIAALYLVLKDLLKRDK